MTANILFNVSYTISRLCFNYNGYAVCNQIKIDYELSVSKDLYGGGVICLNVLPLQSTGVTEKFIKELRIVRNSATITTLHGVK
jgi:hypothetical protein